MIDPSLIHPPLELDDHIRMAHFILAIGGRFALINHPLEDTIQGVDFKFMHVCGQKYGNFHVSLCRIMDPLEPGQVPS